MAGYVVVGSTDSEAMLPGFAASPTSYTLHEPV